jgi:hypothetical protein
MPQGESPGDVMLMPPLALKRLLHAIFHIPAAVDGGDIAMTHSKLASRIHI